MPFSVFLPRPLAGRGKLKALAGTIHILSDIHGDHMKLQHVINNASGSLRPLVERLYRSHLSPETS